MRHRGGNFSSRFIRKKFLNVPPARDHWLIIEGKSTSDLIYRNLRRVRAGKINVEWKICRMRLRKGNDIPERSKSRRNTTFIGEPCTGNLVWGYSHAKFFSCPSGYFSFGYTAKAITSPPPTGARKNRALCLAASGKMRSSPSALFSVLEYRPPRDYSFYLEISIARVYLSRRKKKKLL